MRPCLTTDHFLGSQKWGVLICIVLYISKGERKKFDFLKKRGQNNDIGLTAYTGKADRDITVKVPLKLHHTGSVA